ncbi:hypothetical protein SDC9_59443 [bioreactor metagenome]|uniref:YdhG-like domain-containing protein n=1 Tax=bioreactor metagenome TaxID=1076179 RepID=A0A644XBE3_9ZZZZ
MWKCPRCGREFKNTNQDHYCGEINTIDEYIANQPAEVQPLLQSVRETIHAAAPDAAEKISWQMPTFWQGENIVHFAAFKKHIGLFPGGEAVGVFADRLEGYKTSKGTIQFPLEKPIDHNMIADIVRWRVEQAKGGKSTFSEPVKRERYAMPDFMAAALDKTNLWESYRARPPYQQNDYIGWITRGRQEETRQKRLVQMLEELQAGDAYMGMAYNAKGRE